MNKTTFTVPAVTTTNETVITKPAEDDNQYNDVVTYRRSLVTLKFEAYSDLTHENILENIDNLLYQRQFICAEPRSMVIQIDSTERRKTRIRLNR